MKKKMKNTSPLAGYKKLYTMEYEGQLYEIWQNKKKGALAFILNGNPVQEEATLRALTKALVQRNQE